MCVFLLVGDVRCAGEEMGRKGGGVGISVVGEDGDVARFWSGMGLM